MRDQSSAVTQKILHNLMSGAGSVKRAAQAHQLSRRKVHAQPVNFSAICIPPKRQVLTRIESDLLLLLLPELRLRPTLLSTVKLGSCSQVLLEFARDHPVVFLETGCVSVKVVSHRVGANHSPRKRLADSLRRQRVERRSRIADRQPSAPAHDVQPLRSRRAS